MTLLDLLKTKAIAKNENGDDVEISPEFYINILDILDTKIQFRLYSIVNPEIFVDCVCENETITPIVQ